MARLAAHSQCMQVPLGEGTEWRGRTHESSRGHWGNGEGKQP